MTNKSSNLIRNMKENMKGFSKGQKLIANYIIDHFDKAAYMTAARLGEIVGVSESTVVRFALELGYDGYPKLQKALQELIKSKLTSVQRIEVSSSRINEENILKSVLQSDAEKIKHTLEQIDQGSFNESVESILKAKTIYVIGMRSSAPLANFLGFYFNLLFDHVKLVYTAGASEMFEQILKVSEQDVVIGISFPRYSKRTIMAMRFIKSKGAKLIALTDSKESPIATCADHLLIARSDMASFADSLVAPLSVINALIVAIGIKKKEQIYETFESLEKIWDEFQVYDNNDDMEYED